MIPVERINYVYEDENLKVINPSTKKREELYKKICDIQSDDENLESPELLLMTLNELVITNDTMYSFSGYTIDDMRLVLEELELYPESVKNAVKSVSQVIRNIVYEYYQKLAIQLDEKLIQLEMITAQSKLNQVKQKTKEIEEIVAKAKIVLEAQKVMERENRKKTPKQLIKEIFPNLSRSERRKIEKEVEKYDKEYLEQHSEINKKDFMGVS